MIGFASFVLFTTVISFGLGLATLNVLGQPKPVESALSQSDIYDAIIDNFIQSNQASSTIGVPLSLPAIQSAVKSALPKSVVEPVTNQVINSVYAWVQGKTTTPQFSIDLSSAKNSLATFVGQAATTQAAALPICTTSQLFNELTEITQNSLSITCRPSQVSSTTIGDYAKQEVLSSSFLNKPITPDSLGVTTNGQIKIPSSQNSKTQTIAAPTVYHRFVQDLYVSAVIAALCIAVIVWQHRDKLRGIRRAGGVIAVAGVVCIVEASLVGRIPSWLNSSKLSFSGQVVSSSLQHSIIQTVGILATDFHTWLLNYGIIVFIVGIVTWVGILVLDHKKKEPETPQINTPKDDLSKPVTTA